MLLRTADHWILDNVFQPVANWTKSTLDWGRVPLAIFWGIVWVLFGFLVIFIQIAKDEPMRPLFVLLVLLTSITLPYVIKDLRRSSGTDGVISRERESLLSIFVRLVLLINSLAAIFLIVLDAYAYEETSFYFIDIALLSLWLHKGFLACRNSPTQFKKPAKTKTVNA